MDNNQELGGNSKAQAESKLAGVYVPNVPAFSTLAPTGRRPPRARARCRTRPPPGSGAWTSRSPGPSSARRCRTRASPWSRCEMSDPNPRPPGVSACPCRRASGRCGRGGQRRKGCGMIIWRWGVFSTAYDYFMNWELICILRGNY